MKTISLRQFRDSIQELAEPVAVVKRNGDGTMIVLGAWSPTEDRSPIEETRPIVNAGYVDHVAGFGVSRPAPKPGGKTK